MPSFAQLLDIRYKSIHRFKSKQDKSDKYERFDDPSIRQATGVTRSFILQKTHLHKPIPDIDDLNGKGKNEKENGKDIDKPLRFLTEPVIEDVHAHMRSHTHRIGDT